MCAEMSTLILLYPLLLRGKRSFLNIWGCMAVTMLCAKGVYYLLKMVVVGGEIITTSPPVANYHRDRLQPAVCAGYCCDAPDTG